MKRILKFGAQWCAPCRQQDNILKELNIEVEHIDIDDNDEMVEQYHIMSIPTIVILINDKEINRIVGNVDKQILKNNILL